MICTKHGEVGEKIVNKNGKKAIRCVICYKEYVRRKTNKRAKIKEALAVERGCRCLDCNNTFEPKLLDFHHRDPNQKDFAISDFFRFAAGGVSRKELIEEEAEKCDMLCPVCHRRRHYASIPAPKRPKDKTRLKYKTMLVDAFGGACWSCGDELECFNFDFHHLEEDKKEFSLSVAMTKCTQLSKLVGEAKKCAMLCATCHRKVHTACNDVKIHIKIVDFSVFDHEKPEICHCEVCNTEISKGSSRCVVHAAELRRKVLSRPSKDFLLRLLSENSCTKVGKMYGVSSNCVKKWLKIKPPTGLEPAHIAAAHYK